MRRLGEILGVVESLSCLHKGGGRGLWDQLSGVEETVDFAQLVLAFDISDGKNLAVPEVKFVVQDGFTICVCDFVVRRRVRVETCGTHERTNL